MTIEIIGDIVQIEIIARGNAIREVGRPRRLYGAGRWRKLKGMTTVRLPSGVIARVEVHWYEAHGIGRRDIKIKRILESW